MQANTAGVNRKWTELQEEGSAFCFVLGGKKSKKMKQSETITYKSHRAEIQKNYFPKQPLFVPYEATDLCYLRIKNYCIWGQPVPSCSTLSLAFTA